MKRWIPPLLLSVLLCVLMSSAFLVSCGEKKPPADDEDPVQAIALTEESGAAVFRIVRKDTSDKTLSRLAVRVKTAYAEAIGKQPGEIPITTDDVDSSEEDNRNIPEIIVGATNRTCPLPHPAVEGYFHVSVSGNKIYVCGEGNGPLEAAVEAFEQMMKQDVSKGTVYCLAANAGSSGVWEDPEAVPDDGNPKVLYGLSQKQADSYFGEILDGLFTGKTQETIQDTGIGSEFSFHFPDMVYVNGEYWAYYICYRTDSGKGGVGLATSSDGLHFKDRGCVIQPDEDYDCNGAYFAGVWREEDGTFTIVYECKGGEETEYGTLENVAWATSDDGIHWDKQGVLIYKDTRLPWQTANVGTPDLYRKDGEWYVFFHGFDFQTCQVGLAYGPELDQLTMVQDPIIPTEPDTLWSGTTGRRDVIYVDGYYYMVYEISTEQAEDGGFGGAYWTHKFARSKDLIHWESIEEPLLIQEDASGNPKTGFGYDGPCWVIVGKHLYVYFRNGGSTTRAELTLK